MPVGSPFLSHLQHLTARLDDNDSRDSGDSLDDALSSLVTDLGATVASYCGLRLTVMNSGQPVILTDFPEPGSPTATSLSVPLPLLVPQMGIGSRIVFYAASAGALVDLAADLSHALNVSTNTGRLWGGEQRGGEELTAGMGDDATIRLDADLPPVSMTSGLVGSEQLTTVNRAVGLLIGQGHLPGDAHDLLRRGALAVGLDADRFAARLLGR